MNRAELIAAISDRTGLHRADAERAVAATLGVLADQLARGEAVGLPGFGTFDVVERAARSGRNPRTGDPIRIEARKAPRFRAGKALRDAVASSE